MNILIVDDDEDGAALLTMLLERQGWEVHSAASVQDGHAALRERGCDVLIADLHLPDGEGTALLAGDEHVGLRGAILVTGAGAEESRACEGRERFGFCLKKPINGAEIVRIVRSLLGPDTGQA
jgi:DNA-binding response OmpR family regulator